MLYMYSFEQGGDDISALWYFKQIDPFLQLIDDSRLRVVNSILGEGALYGSSEDNTAVLEFLAAVIVTEDQSTESLVSLIINKLGRLS